jgi:enterochelin esterase-like enzyme
MSRRFVVALFVVLIATASFAQQRTPDGQVVRPQRPRSPEIAADGTVTFRLSAPKATEVLVHNSSGGWAVWPEGGDVPMKKDDQGLWSVTIGPLKPEYYTYSFTVDGIAALDPSNSATSRDGAAYSSALRMTGDRTANYQIKDVPHGLLTQVWYPSPTLNLTRRLYIYTPPGYDPAGTARYPVFYLLHGGGGDEDAWTTLGRAPQILDNLIAAGKTKPMIVVMTNGNANQRASQDVLPAPQGGGMGGPGGPGGAGVPGGQGGQAAQQDPAAAVAQWARFQNSLVNDVIPYVDKNYRTRTDRENRAIAGLSMGGGQTFYIAFNHIDLFTYVGVFSAGWPTIPGISVPIPAPANAADLRGPDITRSIDPEKMFALMPQLNLSANSKLHLLYMHIGLEDGLITSHNLVKAQLKAKGINAVSIETHGYGHEWPFWRVALEDYAPRLFQAAAK